AAVPGAEVPDTHAQAGSQLVLHGDRALPVVVLHVEPADSISRALRARLAHLAEGEVRPGPALTLGRRVEEVAVGHEVAVGVVPRAARRQRLVGRRDVHGRTGVPRWIAAQVHLEGRLAVAKEVVGGADPGAEV